MEYEVYDLLLQGAFECASEIGHVAHDCVASDRVTPIDCRTLWEVPMQEMCQGHVAEHHAVIIAGNEAKFDMRVAV